MRQQIASWLLWSALASWLPAQDVADPASLVARLGNDPGGDAKRQLVALGSEALPALIEGLGRDEATVRNGVLAILLELGADAGAAVPDLLVTSRRVESAQLAPVLWTLAELAPFRDSAMSLDLEEGVWVRAGIRRKDISRESLLAQQRLRSRVEFPMGLEVTDLINVARGTNAYRVELAVELLGRQGPRARAALPDLLVLLGRSDPRILLSERTVALRSKTARAILAIDPAAAGADRARAILAGETLPSAVAAPIPDRVRARVSELLVEHADPKKRDAAAANLVALGELAVPAVTDALTADRDADFLEAGLAVLRELGPRAANAVPALVELLGTLSTDHTLSVMRALTAAGPWCLDVVPSIWYSAGVGHLRIHGRAIAGEPDAAFINEFDAAFVVLRAAMMVDPASSLPELRKWLASESVAIREAALAVLGDRGAEARSLLPTLEGMLAESFKRGQRLVTDDGRGSRVVWQDCTDAIHRRVAHAILAVAAADDPLVEKAQRVLAPK